MNTTNPSHIEYINNNFSDNYKCNFVGNIHILGVYHGTDEYIMNNLGDLFNQIEKKLLHIECINIQHIKSLLLYKFMDFNKILYIMKNQRVCGEWIQRVHLIWKYIHQLFLALF